MTLQQQKKELQKAITFLSDKTRTVAGWEEEKQANLNKVNAHFKEGAGFDTVDFDRLYSAYQKAREIDKNIESQAQLTNHIVAIKPTVPNTRMGGKSLTVSIPLFLRMVNAAVLVNAMVGI